jgi:hypothetical protein
VLKMPTNIPPDSQARLMLGTEQWAELAFSRAGTGHNCCLFSAKRFNHLSRRPGVAGEPVRPSRRVTACWDALPQSVSLLQGDLYAPGEARDQVVDGCPDR